MFGEPIDLSAVVDGRDYAAVRDVGGLIDRACREHGFFSIVGHGVDPLLRRRLETVSRQFFDLDVEEKARIAMPLGGRAWRGWFPAGDELTSGRPDSKEGIYFGTDLSVDDERVVEGRWLHGPNLWPTRPAELRGTVVEWMGEMERVARAVLRAMAMGIGLDSDWFETNLTADPTVLFRIFHYLPLDSGDGRVGPPGAAADPDVVADTDWGVGEHTDYGLLTVLAQDDVGGLEVLIEDRWVVIEPVEDAFVCNIGDMLDRMTGGVYRSTVHRVRAPVGRSRLSFPFFFDPGWDVEVCPVPMTGDPVDGGPADGDPVGDERARRWDGSDLAELTGTYGEYLTMKVGRVFPDLAARAVGGIAGERATDGAAAEGGTGAS